MHLDLGTAIDRYVVEGRLGQGGVATVYRVRHEGLGTVHALKVVHIPSPAITERLLREGRAQGKLRHPNVVAVTDLVSVRGAPGLVMELVPGPPLDHFLQLAALALEEIDLLGRGILAGVAAAHREGLVHRDLKPGNILLEVQDGQVVPKIVDFGLAKALAAPSASPLATRAGASMGTPAYMAPEQIDDASAVDERADVFALGAILFELATGIRAFDAETVPEVYARIRTGAHTPIPAELPPRMQRAIAGALVVDPQRRVPSVVALQQLWADDTPRPRNPWSPATLSAAEPPSAPPTRIERTPSTSTFGGEAFHTTHETFTADDIDVSTVDPSPAPMAPAARHGTIVLAALALALLTVGAVWWLGLGHADADRVLRSDGSTPTLAEPAVQRQFDEAWTAFLGGDFAEAERRLKAVREGVPDQPLPHLLASDALFFLGDVPEALEAMTQARTTAASAPTAPGAGLVEVYRELQLTGDSLGPPLDAWIDAQPDDYLAVLMRAQYCSTTSEVEVCARAHDALLAHDDQQPVAHLARARSWLDLGELDRVRAATADGLAIDPREPGLLAMEGAAWMAEGRVDEARTAYQRALDADPRRRGPKLALACLALLDGSAAWERATAELLAPTVPASERVEVHTEAARFLHAHGRVGEALGHLDKAEAIERAEGTPLGVLTVLSKRSPLVQAQGRTGALSQLVDTQLSLVSRSPEIPNPVRNRYATYRPWADGLLAAEDGNRDGVVQALERVRKGEFEQPAVEERLARELAVLDGDAEAIATNASFFWTSCDRHAALADAYRRAGLALLATDEWAKVLAAPCRLSGRERMARVAAHVGLAEHDVDVATHVIEARALWPAPDPDLPLARRLAALEAR